MSVQITWAYVLVYPPNVGPIRTYDYAYERFYTIGPDGVETSSRIADAHFFTDRLDAIAHRRTGMVVRPVEIHRTIYTLKEA